MYYLNVLKMYSYPRFMDLFVALKKYFKKMGK